MAGLSIPISFSATGQEQVLQAISAVESSLKKMADLTGSQKTTLFAGGIKNASNTMMAQVANQAPQGMNRDSILKTLEAAQSRTLTGNELKSVQDLLKKAGNTLSTSQKEFLESVIKAQQNAVNTFIREVESTGKFTGDSALIGPKKINFANLKTAIIQNITSLRELKLLSDKDLQELEKFAQSGDIAGIIGITTKARTPEGVLARLKEDPRLGTDADFQKMVTDLRARLTKAQQRAFDKALKEIYTVEPEPTETPSTTTGSRRRRKKESEESSQEPPKPPKPPKPPAQDDGGDEEESKPKRKPKRRFIPPPTPEGEEDIPDYFNVVSRRFKNIAAGFANANAVARDSLRTLTPEQVEQFIGAFKKNLIEFRKQTEQVLVESGPLLDIPDDVSKKLAERIVGTVTSEGFGNLTEEQQQQRARAVGMETIREFFPNLDSATAEKAVRIFGQQVNATTKEFKVVTETIDNINAEFSQLNRLKVDELIQKGRATGDEKYYEQARNMSRQRRVFFVDDKLGLTSTTLDELTPEQRKKIPSKVLYDLESGESQTNRALDQAKGRPRTAFEQLATAGGRVAAIFSLIQFTIGNAVQQIQQFVDEANKLEQVSATTQALAGNFESFSAALDLASTQQRNFGGTLNENLQGLSSLIPVSKRYGADLTQLDNIARRLAIVDPLQGFSGASIALKEFFSGDITSLSRRFEIDRATLNSIKEAGDKTAQLQRLDEVLTKLGISNDVLAARSKTTAATFDRLGATVSNLSTSFGFVLQDALSGSANELDNFLGKWAGTTSRLLKDRSILGGIAEDFIKIKQKIDDYFNTPIGDRTQKQLEAIQLEVNDLIRRYNEAKDSSIPFIKDAQTARQFAEVNATGNTAQMFKDLASASENFFRRIGLVASVGTQISSEVGGQLPIGTTSVMTLTNKAQVDQLVIIKELMDQIIKKKNDLSDAKQVKVNVDISKLILDVEKGNLTVSEFIDKLIELKNFDYEAPAPTPTPGPNPGPSGGIGIGGKDRPGRSAQLRSGLGSIIRSAKPMPRVDNGDTGGTGDAVDTVAQMEANLAALNTKVGDYTLSLEAATKVIESMNELTAKQTQSQLEQFAIAQGLGAEYSAQAMAKIDEFKQTTQFLSKEDMDRFQILAKVREALKIQQAMTFEQNKSISIITLMKNNLMGYNITFKEALDMAKEFQSSLRNIANTTLYGKLSLSDQLAMQTNRLSLTGPNAPQNDKELTDTLGNVFSLVLDQNDKSDKRGESIVKIARDDAERRQQLQEDLNKDLLRLQEDYEEKRLELLKNSEVEKRQGKVDFYSSLMNADKLTPEQQKMLSDKYEILFGQVSELRNQGQFDKANALLESGTTQITNEMNYLQEVATQKDNIKEADEDIAKLQEDYSKADSADSRKSILDKIEQRRQDKEIAENRIKQLGEIRTLQIDTDNERVKTAIEAEDRITKDYNKQVEERKTAYKDALKEQDDALKKSMDEANKQFDEMTKKSVVTVTFIESLLKYADEIPKLFQMAQNGTVGQDWFEKTVDFKKNMLIENTPEVLRPYLTKFFESAERLTPGFGQDLVNLGNPLELNKDLQDVSGQLKLLNTTLMRTNEIFVTMPAFLQRAN